MALRAGYYGIKKNVLSAISGLSGAKIIKTIGDGLKLTAAGKLSCDIDTDSMMFKSGKLAAKVSSTQYATTEFETGEKWINGKEIKGKVFKLKANELQVGTVTSSNVKGHIFTDMGIDDYEAVWVDLSKSFIILGTRSESPYVTPLVYPTSNSYVRVNVQQAAAINDGKITVYFDATYGTGVLSNVSGDNYIVVTLLYVEKEGE